MRRHSNKNVATLKVVVKQGTNLNAADSNGLSDPYCKFKYNGIKYKTEVKKATLNPVWNQSFNVPAFNRNEQLIFEIYDWDMISRNDLIGRCYVTLGDDLLHGETLERVQEIRDDSGQLAGSVSFAFTYTAVDPEEIRRHELEIFQREQQKRDEAERERLRRDGEREQRKKREEAERARLEQEQANEAARLEYLNHSRRIELEETLRREEAERKQRDDEEARIAAQREAEAAAEKLRIEQEIARQREREREEERIAREAAERAKLEEEERVRAEAERERLEKERLEREAQEERERLQREKEEQERLERERLEREQREREEAEARRLAEEREKLEIIRKEKEERERKLQEERRKRQEAEEAERRAAEAAAAAATQQKPSDDEPEDASVEAAAAEVASLELDDEACKLSAMLAAAGKQRLEIAVSEKTTVVASDPQMPQDSFFTSLQATVMAIVGHFRQKMMSAAGDDWETFGDEAVNAVVGQMARFQLAPVLFAILAEGIELHPWVVVARVASGAAALPELKQAVADVDAAFAGSQLDALHSATAKFVAFVCAALRAQKLAIVVKALANAVAAGEARDNRAADAQIMDSPQTDLYVRALGMLARFSFKLSLEPKDNDIIVE